MENRDSHSGGAEARAAHAHGRSGRHQHGSGLPRTALLLLVAVLAAGGLAWLVWSWTGSGGDSAPASERSTVTDTAPRGARPSADRGVPDTSAEPLPALDDSDPLVRRLAEEISSRPAVAAWFVPDDLIRRFVVAVTNVANGGTPREQLDFIEVEADFQVRDDGGRTFIDPASYRRYDGVTAAFVSLDPAGSATLYRRLRPLFDEASGELGLGTEGFDPVLARAVRNLLAVRLPSPPVEVEPDGAMYAYAAPALEARTPAEKHLMRMGPDNARRVQEKLRELADALRLEVEGVGEGG